MSGPELLTYVKRRLALENLASEQWTDAVLYDCITEGRDKVLEWFALSAPVAVQELITLDTDPVDDRRRTVPAATKDPIRVLEVRAKTTLEPLTPSGRLNQDGGDYVWLDPRTLVLADNVEPEGGVEILAVTMKPAIDQTTTEAAVGLPVQAHRALGKYAAVLALTMDEETDAALATALLQRELEQLGRLYAEFDAEGGAALRQLMLANYASWMGDML